MSLTTTIRVLETDRLIKSNSLIANFLIGLYIHGSTVNSTMVRLDGTPVVQGESSNMFVANAGGGNSVWGLILGTSASPVDIEDHALDALITSGAGAGQLDYGASNLGPWSRSNNSGFITYTRAFSNNSGADITVREVGIAMSLAGGAEKYLFFREVVDDIIVPNGETRTITVTFFISG